MHGLGTFSGTHPGHLSPGAGLPSPRGLSLAPVSCLELGTTSLSPQVRMLLQVCREAAALPFPPEHREMARRNPEQLWSPVNLWHSDSR